MSLPLTDVRVVAIEQYGAGPWATLQLADLGAEVVKIEDPASGGDVGRYVPPFQEGEDSLFFETFNRNKKSVSLDLRKPEARQVFEDILARSDALYTNLRGDLTAKLRLSYGDLAHINPRIVCCSLSAFGRTGPRAAEPGYDYVIQGMAGWMSLAGEPDSTPVRAGPSLVDLSGGYASAIALLAGIWRARREGVGCDCDVSLFETALQELSYVATWSATEEYVPPRRSLSAHPSMVPFQNFPTADGWIVIACPKQHFWERLCEALGRKDLLEDPRFVDYTARNDNRDALVAELCMELRKQATEDWLAILADAGVPHGPVNGVGEALADPQVVSRGVVVESDHPNLGRVRQLASALRVGLDPLPTARGPFRGEHTVEVLRDLCGYSIESIESLADRGVVVPHDPHRVARCNRASSGS